MQGAIEKVIHGPVPALKRWVQSKEGKPETYCARAPAEYLNILFSLCFSDLKLHLHREFLSASLSCRQAIAEQKADNVGPNAVLRLDVQLNVVLKHPAQLSKTWITFVLKMPGCFQYICVGGKLFLTMETCLDYRNICTLTAFNPADKATVERLRKTPTLGFLYNVRRKSGDIKK